MYYVYILQSTVSSGYYVGHTDDVSRRLKEHNLGMTKYTRLARPWKVMYMEPYATRSAVMRREKEIKEMKSKRYIEKLIKMGERPDTTES